MNAGNVNRSRAVLSESTADNWVRRGITTLGGGAPAAADQSEPA
jgi:hypothetical protein